MGLSRACAQRLPTGISKRQQIYQNIDSKRDTMDGCPTDG